jgi:thioredoxin reductase
MREIEFGVVGGGPAGLSAAIEAAKFGVKVAVFDENDSPGGQLFKQIHKFFGSKEHGAGIRGIDIGTQMLEDAKKHGVEVRLNTAVWGIFDGPRLGISLNQRVSRVSAKKVLLATGANENALAFPGWTLPGVMGAGAAQTMINIHRVLPGKRVLMVGSGNVGLIVSYQLLQAGAEVVGLVEALPYMSGYGVHASKLRKCGVPMLTSHTVKEAVGKERVERAVIVKVDEDFDPKPGTEKRLTVDTICLAVGLSPMAELAWLAGCEFAYVPELGGHVPVHDENMRTTLDGVYVAGDLTGIEEAHTAIEEGKVAGIAVAEGLGYLDTEKALELKQKAWSHLDALRKGPFGQSRAEGKMRINVRREEA